MSLLPAILALLPTFQEPAPPLVVREVLAVESLGRAGRSPVQTDAGQARLVAGAWSAPRAGDTITGTAGEERTWTRFEADEAGWFSGRPFRGGWAWTTVDVPEAGAWRLDVRGASWVLVDGEPHAGDVYDLGLTRVPLALGAGPHELLARNGRGRLRLELTRAPATVYFEERDATLPDVVRGEGGELLCGLIVANAGAEAARGYTVRAVLGSRAAVTDVPLLQPSSFRKCAVTVDAGDAPEEGEAVVALELRDATGAVVHAHEVRLAVRPPDALHVRTFTSDIDGSVQYYALVPPSERTSDAPPALVLSLHGASVEARGQAAAYGAKPDTWIVAPTNRRPYGFDWEDWGRLDALEVLDLAQARTGADPRRTYLTGHSMGGHGTWQLGVHFPDRFAAIAPSAGWRDFWGYAGGSQFPDDDPVGALFARAANASRTLLLERNLAGGGVYVLHGDADDNVPVGEARAMRERLAAFHPNFAYYERKGAGHWWGNPCVDWPPLFEFLGHNERPAPDQVLEVDFTTVSPAVSSRCDWVTVAAQERPLEPSHVHARLELAARTVHLAAENVVRLRLDLTPWLAGPLAPGEPLTVRVGDQEVQAPFTDPPGEFHLVLAGGRWRVGGAAEPWHKSPLRAGPFRDAYRHRMVFVVATHGSPEENAWAAAKARYDHETWRYRGNGAVDVVADSDYTREAYPDRSVILYGNRLTNTAWDLLLEGALLDVTRDAVVMGDRTWAGDDLALLAVYPLAGSDHASVAVVAGTGLAGCRTTDQLPLFVSGVAYPDWTVLGSDFWTQGLAGVRATGFFRGDWALGDDAVWRD